MLQTGARVAYVPSLRVLHNEQRSLAEVFREAWRKGDARVRLARHHGLHELIHMLPRLFCLYLVVASLAVAVRPDLARMAAVPAALYGVVLAILAVQAGRALRSPAAAFAVPVYALALHLSYGMGYWAACSSFLATRSSLEDEEEISR